MITFRQTPPVTTHQWLQPLYTWLKSLWTFFMGVFSANWAPVRLLTAAALPANTYVPATLTKTANANGALPNIDGVAPAVGDRVWDKNAATGSERGLFVIVALGGAGAKWSMVRASDASASGDFVKGKTFQVTDGVANGATQWLLTAANPFVLDTGTPTVAQQAAATVTAIQHVTQRFQAGVDLTDAVNGEAQTINIGAPLPANAVILGHEVQLDAQFTGGGATAVKLDVGATVAQALINQFDVFGSTAGRSFSPGYEHATVHGTHLSGKYGGQQLAAVFTPDGGHALAGLLAGDLTITVWYAILP